MYQKPNKTYVIQYKFYKHREWADLVFVPHTDRTKAITDLFEFRKYSALRRSGLKPNYRLIARKTFKITVSDKVEIA